MTKTPQASRIQPSIPLDLPGRNTGDLMLRWSDNTNPLGHYPIPFITIAGEPGATALFLGGVHGDEFEGPAAIMRLADALEPERLKGRLILIPALNAPAFLRSSRCSPLDDGNLNRAFPGDVDGSPTAMIAHYVETELIPRCKAVADLHSGGKASVFAPCALATRTEDPALFAQNLALAHAMALPTIWVLGSFNDNRSVNSAAARAGVPMIATELGGGGGADPALIARAETGLLRVLAHLGMIENAPAPPGDANRRSVEIQSITDNLYAAAAGLFDRQITAGQTVLAGERIGWLRFPQELRRAPMEITAAVDGFVLAHTNRGLVGRGELLIQIARETDAAQP